MYNLRSTGKRKLESNQETGQNKKAKFNPNSFDNSINYEDIDDSSDKEDIDDNQEEDIDEQPGITTITTEIHKTFPDLPIDDLKDAVERSINKLDEDMMLSDLWKLSLTKEEVEELEPILEDFRKKIRQDRPSIPKILKSNLTPDEKQHALVLYDILANTQPHTHDHALLSKEISSMIRNAPTVNQGDLDPQLKLLEQKLDQRTINLDKILTAHLTEEDKLRALQLYHMMRQEQYLSPVYQDYQQKISSIINSQFSTREEVKRAEEKEADLKKITFNYNADLKNKIFDLQADPGIKKRLFEIYLDMVSRASEDQERSRLRDRLLWAVKLPYKRQKSQPTTDRKLYCQRVYDHLNKNFYGMTEVKEKIIQVVNDRLNNPSSRGILALKGKPGVGKTKLAKVIAEAIGRPFEKISLGGINNTEFLKGSESVWIGSSPSMILQILAQTGYSDPVILLDEIGTLGASQKGMEIQHSLLHILDPSQNKEFNDSFLSDFPHDISRIWFILSMNDDAYLDPALRDRLMIIDVPAYSHDDMIEIMIKHTLPEALEDKGFSRHDVTITKQGAKLILTRLGPVVDHSGMRPVEKAIHDIVSKISLIHTFGSDTTIPLSFNLPNFKSFPYKLTEEDINKVLDQHKTTSYSYYS